MLLFNSQWYIFWQSICVTLNTNDFLIFHVFLSWNTMWNIPWWDDLFGFCDNCKRLCKFTMRTNRFIINQTSTWYKNAMALYKIINRSFIYSKYIQLVLYQIIKSIFILLFVEFLVFDEKTRIKKKFLVNLLNETS